jgi:hypothetical protein
MTTTGIYPAISGHGPQLSDREVALLDALPETAKQSRPATHADLRFAIVELAKRNDYALDLDVLETGFTAVIASDLRVVANKRGTGEETFYCQASNDDLLRMLAEEIAKACGPQLVLPSGGDEGVLVLAPN